MFSMICSRSTIHVAHIISITVLSHPSTPPQPFTFGVLDADAAYKQLLEYVVRVSRLDNYFRVPRKGQSSVGTVGLPSGVAVDFALTKPNGYERDLNKVGAAGELMVSLS